MSPQTPIFLDTNIFLRVLDDGTGEASESCRALLRSVADGDLACWTTHLVVAEIAWTLRSHYGASRERIAETILDLLNMRALQVDRKETLREAIEVYASTNVDLIDAYNAAEARRRGFTTICSYDRDFDRLDVERLEPADALRRGE